MIFSSICTRRNKFLPRVYFLLALHAHFARHVAGFFGRLPAVKLDAILGAHFRPDPAGGSVVLHGVAIADEFLALVLGHPSGGK